ncbi:MAG: arsenate reductase ArsC [Candidatus Bathyarchaeia archaeon]
MTKTKVIFLCTHNSARSQMAEAFLKKYGGDYFDAYSGGFDPKPLNPYTIKVMEEIGYDLSKQQPKDLWQLEKKEHFGIIITVCKRGEEEDCPTIAGPSTRLYWNIEDPAVFEGTEEQKLDKFRSVRNQIETLVKGFLKDRNVPIAE